MYLKEYLWTSFLLFYLFYAYTVCFIPVQSFGFTVDNSVHFSFKRTPVRFRVEKLYKLSTHLWAPTRIIGSKVIKIEWLTYCYMNWNHVYRAERLVVEFYERIRLFVLEYTMTFVEHHLWSIWITLGHTRTPVCMLLIIEIATLKK